MLHVPVTVLAAEATVADYVQRVAAEIRQINEDLRDTSPWVFFVIAVLAFLLALLVFTGVLAIHL